MNFLKQITRSSRDDGIRINGKEALKWRKVLNREKDMI
jgi:hypothetical protein